MASIAKPPPLLKTHIYSRSPQHCPLTLSFPFFKASPFHVRLCALKTGPDGGGRIGSQEVLGPGLLRKPVVAPRKELARIEDEEEESERKGNSFEEEEEDGDNWVDWEDKILEDTVPLVGFVRMILHSDKYTSGSRLSPEHERTILERLLPFHPEFEKKIGCGIDFITVGYHPDFERSRCLFIVQKDGELVDFSYWKCIKGLIRKKYPLYADSFILRHFRQQRRRRNL